MATVAASRASAIPTRLGRSSIGRTNSLSGFRKIKRDGYSVLVHESEINNGSLPSLDFPNLRSSNDEIYKFLKDTGIQTVENHRVEEREATIDLILNRHVLCEHNVQATDNNDTRPIWGGWTQAESLSNQMLDAIKSGKMAKPMGIWTSPLERTVDTLRPYMNEVNSILSSRGDPQEDTLFGGIPGLRETAHRGKSGGTGSCHLPPRKEFGHAMLGVGGTDGRKDHLARIVDETTPHMAARAAGAGEDTLQTCGMALSLTDKDYGLFHDSTHGELGSAILAHMTGGQLFDADTGLRHGQAKGVRARVLLSGSQETGDFKMKILSTERNRDLDFAPRPLDLLRAGFTPDGHPISQFPAQWQSEYASLRRKLELEESVTASRSATERSYAGTGSTLSERETRILEKWLPSLSQQKGSTDLTLWTPIPESDKQVLVDVYKRLSGGSQIDTGATDRDTKESRSRSSGSTSTIRSKL